MGKMKIIPLEVKLAANTLRQSAERLSRNFNTFNDIEEEIESAWKSQYTRGYLDCLDETEERLRKAKRSIVIIAGRLDGIAAAVEEAEAELERIMSCNGSGGGGGGSW